MEFDLINMVVSDLKLGEPPEETELGTPNQFKMQTRLEYNTADKVTIKISAQVGMISLEKYAVTAVFDFYFKFRNEVTGEEADQYVQEAKIELLIFPHVSSYMTNFLVMSGYTRPSIPWMIPK